MLWTIWGLRSPLPQTCPILALHPTPPSRVCEPHTKNLHFPPRPWSMLPKRQESSALSLSPPSSPMAVLSVHSRTPDRNPKQCHFMNDLITSTHACVDTHYTCTHAPTHPRTHPQRFRYQPYQNSEFNHSRRCKNKTLRGFLPGGRLVQVQDPNPWAPARQATWPLPLSTVPEHWHGYTHARKRIRSAMLVSWQAGNGGYKWPSFNGLWRWQQFMEMATAENREGTWLQKTCGDLLGIMGSGPACWL